MADRGINTGFSDPKVGVEKGFGENGLDATEYSIEAPFNITPEDGQFTIGPKLSSTHLTGDDPTFNAQMTQAGLIVDAAILDLTPKTTLGVYGGGGVAISGDFAENAHGDADSTAAYFEGGVKVNHEFGTNNMFNSIEATAGYEQVNNTFAGSGMDADGDTGMAKIGVKLNF